MPSPHDWPNVLPDDLRVARIATPAEPIGARTVDRWLIAILVGLALVFAVPVSCWRREWRDHEATAQALRVAESREADHLRVLLAARRRGDSLYKLSKFAQNEANAARSRFAHAERALPPIDTASVPEIPEHSLPPVVGGWALVITEAHDSLPTPRPVIAMLRQRDSVLTLAASAIEAMESAGRLNALTLDALTVQIEAADSVTADVRAQLALTKSQSDCRILWLPCPSRRTAFVAGAVVGVGLLTLTR